MRKINAPITDDSGARPIIVADERDLVSDVLVKAGRTGGYANLFVVDEHGEFVSASMLPDDAALSPGEHLDEPVHRDIEIGMLLAAAGVFENGVTVRVELPRQSGYVQQTSRPEVAA